MPRAADHGILYDLETQEVTGLFGHEGHKTHLHQKQESPYREGLPDGSENTPRCRWEMRGGTRSRDTISKSLRSREKAGKGPLT